MKKNVQIAIETPCSEKWSSFTPTAQGGFCSSCEKEVIDFTSWSDERIKIYFKNASGVTCGRFRQEQLKVYEFDKPVATSLGWLPAFFAGILLLFSSQQSKAQGTVKHTLPTEQYEPEKRVLGEIVKKSSPIKVSGVVRSSEEGGALLPGINVVRKGTEQGTVTDAEGRFTLNIEIPASAEVLVFSFIGYRSQEYVVTSTKAEQEIEINIELDTQTLGGVGLYYGGYKWYNPRTWWRGIRRLFY